MSEWQNTGHFGTCTSREVRISQDIGVILPENYGVIGITVRGSAGALVCQLQFPVASCQFPVKPFTSETAGVGSHWELRTELWRLSCQLKSKSAS